MYEFLGVEGFERRFGNVYRSIVWDIEVRKQSFHHQDWSFILTSSFWNTKTSLEPLYAACKSIGDEEIVMTNLHFGVRHQWSCVMSADYESYLAAMRDREAGLLLADTKAVFGPSGMWAAIIDNGTVLGEPSSYAIWGGVTAFIDELVNSMGGIKLLREWFIGHLNDPLRRTPISKAVQSDLLADAGWSLADPRAIS
jgi:hypothetical protein